MSYTGYTKIYEAITDAKTIPKNMKWIVTEKVHGSCFCFIYDTQAKNLVCAKRKSVLKDGEYFFGYADILPEYLPKIQAICLNCIQKLKLDTTLVIHINVYGELFGGSYPGIESKYKPVQSGIYYSPNLHFYAFDISYISNGIETYVDFETSLEIFKSNEILHAEPLKIYNSLGAAIEHKIGFDSTIPTKLKLPALKDKNTAEGIVIRSSRQRHIMKIKIKEFAESEIYDDNNYDGDNTVDILKNEAKRHITRNRLNSAISKVGPIDEANNLDTIVDTLIMDIFDELLKNPNLDKNVYEMYDWLDGEVREFINKKVDN